MVEPLLPPDVASDIRREMRRRKKRKNRLLIILAVGVAIFTAASLLFYFALRPDTLRVAVGPAGSDDQKLIEGLAAAFARDADPVRFSPVITRSAAESVTLLGMSKVDLAVVRGDLDLPTDFRSIAILRKNIVVLWSAPNARHNRSFEISTIGDLAGHRVGVLGQADANITLLRVILQESGVRPDTVAVTQFGIDDIVKMAHDPALDAFMAVGPADDKTISNAIAATAARGELKFLPVDVSETIAQKHPRYESEEILASTFSTSPPRPDDKVETVSINHLLVSGSALPETTGGNLIRQLLSARQTLARKLPSAAHIEKPDTDKDAALPAHPGAAAYIDGTERTFLEKYSDYIWGSFLLLSGLGSVGVWLRHYRTRDEKEQHKVHRDRILVALSAVRTAGSAQELEAMQHQVDDILRETLECFDDGAIEGEDLSAIGLVLEQFHHAVADRRRMLSVSNAAAPDLH